MKIHEIEIKWNGPYNLNEVLAMKDAGTEKNNWDGEDYGLYQIYGRHIFRRRGALLYIGIATDRTFSKRFCEHKKWLHKDQDEEDIKIFLGRVYDPDKHKPTDDWATWDRDVKLAEKILIYKYSPHYNSKELGEEPNLWPFKKIRILHTRMGKNEGNRLEPKDNIPWDFYHW